jgi:hypothetical protein
MHDHDAEDERPVCEECYWPTTRSCKRCGQRICRRCATDHQRRSYGQPGDTMTTLGKCERS